MCVPCRLHVMSCDLHVMSCNLHVMSCDLHVMSCNLHVMSCDLHVMSCDLHRKRSAATLQYYAAYSPDLILHSPFSVLQFLHPSLYHLPGLVPRPHPLTRRNGLVSQVEFLGLAHTFTTFYVKPAQKSTDT